MPKHDATFISSVMRDQWFTSTHINTALYILRRQYPNISGFTDVEYLKDIGVLREGPTPNKKFIQIIHQGDNHWITISNM